MGKTALLRIFLKAAALFIVFNVLYYVVQPLNVLNRLSVYNTLVPGRLRLPFGEFPDESYNISILSLDQMLASHEIARPKAPDEYRIAMIGDSSVWGYLIKPTQTQAACMNELGLTLPSGRRVRVYNLGYPKLTVVKDLLILRHALQYKPDLIIWSTSLASLYPSDQLDFRVITAQYDELAALQNQYQFKLYQWPLPPPTRFDKTLFGQRRELANWLRYQLYGLGWTATGTDHSLPKFVTPHPVNLAPDDQLVLAEPMLMRLSTDHKILPEDLSFDVVKVGIDIAAAQNVPVLLVNEPIYRSSNNELRWNYYYPKWAYDSYRTAMKDVAAREGWHYVDVWDAVPVDQFTDTDFHLTPSASCAFAEKLSEPVVTLANAPR
jgi:hypothetical protein